ncbi:MAG: competence protein CoiA family protein [Undibacterium sp.]|nr:competence protein CoiA family protein [Undibacterium sp.]
MTLINKNEFLALDSNTLIASEFEPIVVFARNSHGQFVHIDSVPNGKACDCTCLACGEPLVARQGSKKAHSFAHESGAECQYAIETMLHWLAKELFASRSYFVTPSHTISTSMDGPIRPINLSKVIPSMELQIDSVEIEKRVASVRPDILINVQGKEYLIEIFVTHKCDEEKISKLKEIGLSSIEIDLSKFKLNKVSDLEQVLFFENDLKTWLFDSKIEEARRALVAEAMEEFAKQEIEHNEVNRKRRVRELEQLVKQQTKNQQKISEDENFNEISKSIETEKKLKEIEKIKSSAQKNNWTEAQSHFFHLKNFQTLSYTTIDGGLDLFHGSMEFAYCKPKSGKERALEVFQELNIEFDPIIQAYSFHRSQLKPIIINLSSYSLGIRSL